MYMLQGSILVLSLFTIAMANQTEESRKALRAVSDGAAEFSSNFYDAVAKEATGNLISSPLSAGLVLAMAAYGAGGKTKEEFQKALHLPDEETFGQRGFQALIDSLNNVPNVDLKIANKAFVNEGFNVKKTYEDLTKTYFRSASQSLDFGKSEAVTTINDWVEKSTNNRIKELFKPGDFDAMTALVLTNAVYFKGFWKDKFPLEATENLPFHVNKDTVITVPTMRMEKKFKYGEIEELNAKYIELPYEGEELSMIIILPNEIDGLPRVEEKLKGKNLRDLLNGYKIEVDVQLPKFKIESEIDLKETLIKLGLTDMFENSANFSGISDHPLKVSKAVQKAFIEVNEEGSEAAAATGMGIVAFSLPIIQEFKIDHPFIYTIVKTLKTEENDVTDIIPIFSGRVTEP